MRSPQPATSESMARRRRLMTWGAAGALLLALSVCLAWLTHTGFLGFGIALFGLAATAIGLLCLRELRRITRTLHRTSDDITGAKQRTSSESSLRSIQAAVDANQHSMEAMIAGQIEANRELASGLRAATLDSMLEGQLRQQQAMLNLFGMCKPERVVPAMGGSAPASDVIVVLTDSLLLNTPRLVVECGSGVATLWMALAIRRNGLESKIVCLEHDVDRAENTRRVLRQHGVDDIVEIRCVPLTSGVLAGHAGDWYDVSALHGLLDVGLLFVDGPPASHGPMARFPAVPLMRDVLAPTATIVLDDACRPAERETTTRWRIHLPDFDYQHLSLATGAALFERRSGPGMR